MPGLLRHALHLSWGIVDIVRRLAVLVFAGGVERLVCEDLAGLQAGGDGPAVVDEQFGHASCVVLPRLKIRRLPAMLFCVTQPRLSILWIPGPMVTSARAGSARLSLGMGCLRVAPGLPAGVSRRRCSSSLACVPAASSGAGRALPLARYAAPGGRRPSARCGRSSL